jgi:pimeloyl-ACP methyl ester carboxylesterase
MAGPLTTQPDGVDRSAVVGGVRLHFRDWGPRSGPPVLLVHGIMGHSREWDAVTSALAIRHRVVAVDLPGHGESDRSDRYTAEGYADVLAALAVQEDLAPTTIIGHSLGAIVACVLAAARTDLVDRLVVLDVGPDVFETDLGRRIPDVLDELAEASYASVVDAVDQWLSDNPRARPHLTRHFVEHGLVTRDDGRLVWRFDARRLARFTIDGVTSSQIWAAIDAIVAPTLVVRGQYSTALSRPTAQAMLQRLWAGYLAEIPGAGHDLAVENPEDVTAVVAPFLPQP